MKGSSMPQIYAYAIIDAPPERLWKIISDCSTYHKTMPSIEKSRYLKALSPPGKIRCELVVNLPWPMDDLRSVTDAVHTIKASHYKRQWTLVEGDYRLNNGSWKLTAIDRGSKTFIEYKVHVEPKTSVPDFIKRAAQKSKIPDLIDHLRESVTAQD